MGIDAAKMHDALLAAQPEGARHDIDICPFCIARADENAAEPMLQSASIPSGDEPLDAPIPNDSPEGGTTTAMSDTNMISRDAHEALLEKALKDATTATEEALGRKLEEVATLSGQVETLTNEKAELVSENERLSNELDAAQVALKAATDEVAAFKDDIAAKEAAAAKAELASKRAAQVEELGLFGKEYIAEKASKWADVAEEAWQERVEEWRNLKPATTGTDAASAMSGASGVLTDEPVDEAKETNHNNARRSVLGLS